MDGVAFPKLLPNMIGFAGKAGSGKNYLAELLRSRYYVPMAFALALKQESMAVYGFSAHEVFVEKRPEVRKILQQYGVTRREATPKRDWWTKRAGALMDALTAGGVLTPPHRWVMTDVRFPNEVDFVRERGGAVFRIVTDRPYPLAGTPAGEHESETALDHLELPEIDNREGMILNPADLMQQLRAHLG